MDTSPNAGSDLVRVHKAITRGLNVSLEHCQDPSLAEGFRPGYISYVRSLVILLHAHHTGEDEIAFPFWKSYLPSGPFEELSRQHRQMVSVLEKIECWTEKGLDAWQSSALGGLESALSELNRLWKDHIALEEETIGPKKSRQYLSPAENEQLGRQLGEHGAAHAEPNELVFPFVIYNLSGEDRVEFSKALPAVITSQLIPVDWKPAWSSMTPFLLID